MKIDVLQANMIEKDFMNGRIQVLLVPECYTVRLDKELVKYVNYLLFYDYPRDLKSLIALVSDYIEISGHKICFFQLENGVDANENVKEKRYIGCTYQLINQLFRQLVAENVCREKELLSQFNCSLLELRAAKKYLINDKKMMEGSGYRLNQDYELPFFTDNDGYVRVNEKEVDELLKFVDSYDYFRIGIK